jgi:hypothetical protein
MIAVVAMPIGALAQASGISLQAKAIATGGRVRTWGGGGTSYIQDYAFDRTTLTQDFWTTRQRESKVGLEIDVRNFRRSAQSVEVLALFIARDIDTREAFLLSAEQAVFTLLNGEFTRTWMYSGVARNTSGRSYFQGTTADPYGYYPYLWSASDVTEGTKLGGWIVLAMVNGRVVETRTSGPTMESIANDRAALKDLMRPLLAAQRPRPPQWR